MPNKVLNHQDYYRSSFISGVLMLDIYPFDDRTALAIRMSSTSQTKDLVRIMDSGENPIWKITGSPIIEFYKDTNFKSGANIVHNAHTTRIVSGLYVRPLLNTAILSGSLDANSTKINNLTAGSSALDAVNVDQMNTAVSGAVNVNQMNLAVSGLITATVAFTNKTLLNTNDLGGLVGAKGIKFPIFGQRSTAGTQTVIGMNIGDQYMDVPQRGFPFACKLIGIDVNIQHTTGSGVGPWTAVVHNASSNGTATKSCPVPDFSGNDNITTGAMSTDLVFLSGERFRFYVQGPGIMAPQIVMTAFLVTQ